MRRIAAAHGPEAVAFSQSSASTTAIGDSAPFIRRLMNAFGTPEHGVGTRCLRLGSRAFATRYVYGVGSCRQRVAAAAPWPISTRPAV